MIEIAALVASCVALIAVVFVQRKAARLERSLAEQTERTTKLQDEIRALLSGATGLTEHLAKAQAQLKRLSQRQDQLDMRDPQTQAYDYAITIARRGASREELMRRCGLVRDEAELLVRMYGMEKAG